MMQPYSNFKLPDNVESTREPILIDVPLNPCKKVTRTCENILQPYCGVQELSKRNAKSIPSRSEADKMKAFTKPETRNPPSNTGAIRQEREPSKQAT